MTHLQPPPRQNSRVVPIRGMLRHWGLVACAVLTISLARGAAGDVSSTAATELLNPPWRLSLQDAFPNTPPPLATPRLVSLLSPERAAVPAVPVRRRVPSARSATAPHAARPGASAAIATKNPPRDVVSSPSVQSISASEKAASVGISRQSESVSRLGQLSRPPSGPDAIGDILPRLLGTSATVIVACVATLFLSRRWLLRAGVRRTGAGGRLRITATLPLPSQGLLHIIRVDNRDYLAGTDSQGIKQLLAMSPPFADLMHEVADSGGASAAPLPAMPPSFHLMCSADAARDRQTAGIRPS